MRMTTLRTEDSASSTGTASATNTGTTVITPTPPTGSHTSSSGLSLLPLIRSKSSSFSNMISSGSGNGSSILGGSPASTQLVHATTNLDVEADVVKMGYLRKFKGKKKWFVIRRESESGPARLDYYAKERYFRLGQQPRRTICLKACFNINRTDSKIKWAIALHTHNDCLRIVCGSEEEMKEWLQLLNSHAGTEEEPSEDTPNKPHFEHVWIVHALNKGLGSKEGIIGPYRLCLTSRELTLLKVGDGEDRTNLVFPLNVIRSVSHDSTFGCFFHIEFGRLAVTGPGQLSLRTEDNNIAQNMHLLILKAMQNYSKEDIAYSGSSRRGRTYTWNSGYSDSATSTASRPVSLHSQTPPILTRIHSVDSGTPRVRTESMNSTDSRSGASPPMPISLSHQTPPTIYFQSSLGQSTTDSASSSFSVDYENNNNGRGRDGDSYVPWNPGEEAGLSLPLQPLDTADYVSTGGQQRLSSSRSDSCSGAYMDMRVSSPYDHYMPMSPGSNSLLHASGGSGKISTSHSRNSSLVEELEGYVPMIPSNGQQPMTPMSNGVGLGSISSQIDSSSYLEMDLRSNSGSRRKANLSSEDRSLPASSVESLQSRTPSSDFPLEKVSSYLLPTEDLDDPSSQRPVRCYSVGSKSDTGATLKGGRYGRNRLEAVQETFRIRALSVGAKNPRGSKGLNLFSPPPLTPPSSVHGSNSSVSTTGTGPPLSSSWSGSTGRWAPHKSMSPASSVTAHQDHGDSDLMELDFSHNREKKGRRTSLSGIRESTSSSKGSPSPVGSQFCESPATDGGGVYMLMSPSNSTGLPSPKYPSSQPIPIQSKTGCIGEPVTGSGILLASRLSGLDLNLKSIPLIPPPVSEDGGYMSMDFTPTKPTIENSDSALTRIEESPEKLELMSQLLHRRPPPSTIREEDCSALSYADVECMGYDRVSHPVKMSPSRPSYPPVTYSQIDFKKSTHNE